MFTEKLMKNSTVTERPCNASQRCQQGDPYCLMSFSSLLTKSPK